MERRIVLLCRKLFLKELYTELYQDGFAWEKWMSPRRELTEQFVEKGYCRLCGKEISEHRHAVRTFVPKI